MPWLASPARCLRLAGLARVLQVRPLRAGEGRGAAALDPSCLRKALLRAREGGEQFQAAPHATARSLKKQYQAAGVPAWQRVGLWCSATAGRLLFVPGLGLDARVWAPSGPGWSPWNGGPTRQPLEAPGGLKSRVSAQSCAPTRGGSRRRPCVQAPFGPRLNLAAATATRHLSPSSTREFSRHRRDLRH